MVKKILKMKKYKSTKTLIRQLTIFSTFFGALEFISANHTLAAVIFRMEEVGPTTIEYTLSGTLNVSGLTPNGSFVGGSVITPNTGSVFLVNPSGLSDVYLNAVDNPSNLVFGTGGGLGASVISGTFFSFFGTSQNRLDLPDNYNGEEISGSGTLFASGNFADLGITPGIYTSGFNSGADTITYVIGDVMETVPEPSTILSLLTIGGIALGASKKKQG